MKKGKAQISDIEAKYTLIREIGKGGNAKVYEAKNIDSQEVVALKRLEKREHEKEERFLNELHVMTGYASSIPGIIPILDQSAEHFWYTMPIATLAMEEMAEVSIWTPKEIISAFLQLAETLSTLHEQGISHRDIKPGNIYIYNSRLVFGDFGLVEFPDAETLTKSGRGLGSTFTIAPEMKRNPKDADGKPADVYSMAKTLWMLLTRDEKGFDGQYNEDDNQHRLSSYGNLGGVHLLEIEKLLSNATRTEPKERPTIQQFVDEIKLWLQIIDDEVLCQTLDWEHLTKRLFNGNVPDSVTYRGAEEIVQVLNAISKSPAFNHMLTPPHGGLDLNRAELSAEPGCIKIFATGCCMVIKPKTFHFEGFDDVRWSYFLLEASPQEKILGNENDEWDEFVVEDTPGHYVDGTDSCYGVYDYESGKPLPDGWCGVFRVFKGNFLFVLKLGLYNDIHETYDGRHNQCSAEEFRNLIGVYAETYKIGKEKGLSDSAIFSLNLFRVNPYGEFKLPTFEPRLPSPHDFVNANYQNWQFAIPEQGDANGALAFYFVFDNDFSVSYRLFEQKEWIMNNQGKIVEHKRGDMTDVFTICDRESALDKLDKLNEQIVALCDGYDTGLGIASFKVEWIRVRKPSHLFTKEEMLKLYKEADDRRGNKLVIDEEGYVQMLPPDVDGTLYPVCHETFCERNNIVGKYSKLLTFEFDYLESIYAWLKHLQTGTYVYCDGSVLPNKEAEEKLIDEIKQYY